MKQNARTAKKRLAIARGSAQGRDCWRKKVRREKALDFSGCNALPGTGSPAEPVVSAVRQQRQDAKIPQTVSESEQF
jgi:hypothetical protein